MDVAVTRKASSANGSSFNTTTTASSGNATASAPHQIGPSSDWLVHALHPAFACSIPSATSSSSQLSPSFSGVGGVSSQFYSDINSGGHNSMNGNSAANVGSSISSAAAGGLSDRPRQQQQQQTTAVSAVRAKVLLLPRFASYAYSTVANASSQSGGSTAAATDAGSVAGSVSGEWAIYSWDPDTPEDIVMSLYEISSLMLLLFNSLQPSAVSSTIAGQGGCLVDTEARAAHHQIDGLQHRIRTISVQLLQKSSSVLLPVYCADSVNCHDSGRRDVVHMLRGAAVDAACLNFPLCGTTADVQQPSSLNDRASVSWSNKLNSNAITSSAFAREVMTALVSTIPTTRLSSQSLVGMAVVRSVWKVWCSLLKYFGTTAAITGLEALFSVLAATRESTLCQQQQPDRAGTGIGNHRPVQTLSAQAAEMTPASWTLKTMIYLKMATSQSSNVSKAVILLLAWVMKW